MRTNITPGRRMLPTLMAAVLISASQLNAGMEAEPPINMSIVSGTVTTSRNEAVLPLAPWNGFESVVRYRQVRSYRPGSGDASLRPASQNVWDVTISRPLGNRAELSLAIENLTNRSFFETQNFPELRLSATPTGQRQVRGFTADPFTLSAQITFNLSR